MNENKRFKIKLSDIGELMDCDTQSILAVSSIANELIPLCELLNSLADENEQLKQEKENWKSSACNNANFNSILLNELGIAQEQGYKVSDPFKKLMEEKGDVE